MSKKTETAVATAGVEESRFVAIRPDNPVRQAMEENGEEMSLGALPWVKMPTGGATTWTINDLGNETHAKEISGAMVIYRQRWILWPTDGEAQEGTMPFMVSEDNRRARIVGDDHGDLDRDLIEEYRIEGTDWYDVGKDFPYKQFGSGGAGRPRGKEQRIIGILRPESMLPLMVAISPGSIASVRNTVLGMQLPFWRHSVTLGLVEAKNRANQKYARATLRVDEVLPEDVALALKASYTDPINAAIEGGAIAVDA